MPRLSIVIPALGRFDLLESTLLSVFDHHPDDCEIVVVHRGDYSDPYQLDGEVRFVVADAPDWMSAANAGIAVAGAPIVHLLARGIEVEEDWTGRPLSYFANPNVAAVSLELHSRRNRSGGEENSTESRQAAHEPAAATWGPLWWAGFYRRAALEQWAMPFDPSIGESVADWDLALRLGAAGFAAVREPSSQAWAGFSTLPRQGPRRRAWQTLRLARRHASRPEGMRAATASAAWLDAALTLGFAVCGSERGLARLEQRMAGRVASCNARVMQAGPAEARSDPSSASSRLDASHGVAGSAVRGAAHGRPGGAMRESAS